MNEPLTPPGRLLLRLTTQCNSRCAHCGIADIAGLPDRTTAEALDELRRARARGAGEVVFLRGEPTARADLAPLAAAARQLGYRVIQVQTNGRLLAQPRLLDALLAAGVNFFEVSLFGHVPALHDLIDGTPGAGVQVMAALSLMGRRQVPLLVTVPVLRRNYLVLPQVAARAAQLGVRRIQFNYPRPVRVDGNWNTAVLVRLAEAAPHIRAALRAARRAGLRAETEAVPFCHLDADMREGLDATESFARHAVIDLHRRADSLTEHRREARPRAPECAGCAYAERCPTTWAAAQDLFGTADFTPLP